MQAGRLNTPIVIQQPATGTDAIGQPLTGWVDFAAVWAHVRHLSGTESIKAGATVSAVQASMRIRTLAGVTAGMRVVAAGQVYAIKAVLPNMQSRDHTDLVTELIQ
jgi:SPP1 family predicted phage head-tail adaptor